MGRIFSKNNLPVVLFLGAAIVAALVLRLPGLATLPFYNDETYHSHQAVQMLSGQPITYTRAFLPVTLPVYLTFLLLGVSWFKARLPMLLFNALAVIPLFAVGKKINTYAGWLAVFLYVTNPLNIASARSVREYAVLPLFFYLVFWVTQALLDETLPAQKQRWAHVGAALLLVYMLLIDTRGFFVLGSIPILAAYLLRLVDWLKPKAKPWMWGALAAGLLLGGATVVWRVVQAQLASDMMVGKNPITFNTMFLEFITTSTVQHSYYLAPLGWLLLGLVLLPLVRYPWQTPKSRFLLILSGLYIFSIIFISVFMGLNGFSVRERYQILPELLSFILWGTYAGELIVWLLAKARTPVAANTMRAGLLLLFVLLFTNLGGLQMINTYKGGSSFPITGNNHFEGAEAYDYLAKRLNPKDILIADRFYFNDEMGGYRFGKYHYIDYKEVLPRGNERLQDKMPSEQNGWLALYVDVAKKNIKLFPEQTFDAGNIHFKFHGKFGDTYIWYWTRK